MGGPERARLSQSTGGRGAGVVESSARSSARGARSAFDGEASTSTASSSFIPHLDSSTHDAVSDGNMREFLSNVDSSRAVMGPPSMAASASRRPVLAGSLSSRKPNLHLSLGDNSQSMSRFSAFSSNAGTPSGDSIQRGLHTMDSPVHSRAGSSPSVSLAASPPTGTPVTDPASIAGLGIGMLSSNIPSSRALHDLGDLCASSSQSLSSAIASNSNYSTHPASRPHLPPQTPDRLLLASTTEQTPARSPANTYDRAGQIGIGELSTPRWTSNLTTQGWSTEHDYPANLAAGRPSESTPTSQMHFAEGESRHARAISFSATAPLQARQSSSRPAAASATLSPSRDVLTSVVPSPSMPAFGPSLGVTSSLATLAHQFNNNDERERAVKKLRQGEERALPKSRTEVDTPDYSINAMSESEDDLVADVMPPSLRKQVGSPRIGDTAWSEEETGPFAVAQTPPRSGYVAAAGQSASRGGKAAESKAREARRSEDQDGRGFDLNAAIAELNAVEEARKRARKAAGYGPEMGLGSTRSSGEEHTALGQEDAAQTSSIHRTPSTRKSQGSERDRNNEASASARRQRGASSPSAAKTPSMARLPSSSSAQSISSAKKRSSSASIGHSLLRGTLPLGASNEYEGMLAGGDDAAEALRMLDGAGSTRRSSMGRDREQSKSPRSSKQLLKPSSEGRRISGSTSRTSSPTNKHRESTYNSRQQREEAKAATSRRASRSMGKVKNADEGTISPSSLPLDSPKRGSYSSPRIKRTALPPLPTSHGVSNLAASPSVSNANLSASNSFNSDHRLKDGSRRASAASIASSSHSVNRSLAATTTKSHRVSDTSSVDAQDSSITGLGLASADDKSMSSTSLGLAVPPVPPLPKAWEGTRTTSLHSMDNSTSQMTSSTSNGSWVPLASQQQQSSPSTEGALAPQVVTKKWSFSNLGGTLSSKKSEEKLKGRKSLAVQSSSPSTALNGPNQQQASVTNGLVDSRSPNGSFSESSLTSPISPGENVGMAPSDGAVAPTPVTASANPEALQSPSVATFRNRRTPSFFRKKSSEALVDQSSSSVRPGSERQRSNASVASQNSSEKARTEIPTPSGGRSSRKSILGIGNMLRNASKRNIDTMPTSIPPSSSEDKSFQSIGEDSVEVKESTGRVSSTPRIPSLKNIRRSSLIGRKRGKTLPSSTDSPPVAGKGVPPVQSMPIADSPSPSISSRPPRESVLSNMSGNRSAETPNRKTGDASMSTSQELMQLPTITASPLAKPSALAMDRDVSTDGSQRRNTDALPASRIPRATTYGSIKRNNLPSSTQSTLSTKKAMGAPTSAMSSSKTAFSLAANLGIAPEGDDLSNTTSLGSATLISILNAYTNAKTPAEVEVVLRRARVASHSSTTSAREKEVLVSLVARQEQRKQTDGGIDNTQEAAQNTPLTRTPKASEAHRLNSALSTSSNGHAPITGGSNSVPRRPRISMSATTASARAAREATTLSASKTTHRLSATPTHNRQSPAPQDAITTPGGTPSTTPPLTTPAPLPVHDEEREGDEEMEAYIRRRHHRKVAQGANLADLEKTLQFPEDEPPSRCYSHRQAEALWGDRLTDLEMEEMRNFKEIYFVGQNVDKRARLRAENASANNLGYDDERGDYIVINHDHLAYRYEVTNLLGRGSFGQVLQCKDHKTGRSVAIKLIRNKKRFHHQALVEVKILDNLVKWDPNDEHNVIKILDSFYFRNHLCISMEMLSINLYELIKANSFVGFSTKLIRRLTSQVLASLTLLRKNRVVHCDLKPENILLMHPRKSAIKVIDFGSSCFEHEKVYTYIQSRFYRSPEVILGMNYHTAIDIWSLACIMAELYSGYPLFPGENEQEQLACIMEIMGPPDRYLVDKSSRKKLFFDSTGAPRPVVNSKGRRRRPSTKTLSSALNCNDELFLDFLTKCLHWDPDKRLKPEAALRHPWIKRNSEPPAASQTAKFASSTASSNISAPTSRRAMFTSMTSSSSSAGLAKTASSASKPLNIPSHQMGMAKSALAASQFTSRANNGTSAINPATARPARHERRISLRNSLNPNSHSSSMNTSSPLRNSAARSHQQPVS